MTAVAVAVLARGSVLENGSRPRGRGASFA